MSNHTPGPWYWGFKPFTEIAYVGAQDNNTPEHTAFICEIPAYIGNDANASLIAAAPDLLEALITLADCSPCQNGCKPDDMTCASNLARAAIAKAKGASV